MVAHQDLGGRQRKLVGDDREPPVRAPGPERPARGVPHARVVRVLGRGPGAPGRHLRVSAGGHRGPDARPCARAGGAAHPNGRLRRPMVLNYIWVGFFLIALIVGLVRLIGFGDTAVFTNMVTSTFDSAKTGFEISLGLTGVLTLWLGLMKVGEQG